MIKLYRISIVFIILSLGIIIYAQDSRSNLEAKRKDLVKQIESTSKLLNQTSKSRQNTVYELGILQKQINSRAELIKVSKSEMDSIDMLVICKQEEIEKMEDRLSKMKKSYRKVLLQLYKYKSSDRTIHFLVSNKGYKKIYEKQVFLSQLEKRRSEQARLIREVQQTLRYDVEDLEEQKTEKKRLFDEIDVQNAELNLEIAEKDKIIKQLKSKEDILRKELKEKENSRKNLNNQIEKVIREQQALAKKQAEAKAKANAKTNTGSKTNNNKNNQTKTTKPAPVVADDSPFARSKGKLFSPVSGGVIVSRFGKQQHPLFDQVFTYNNGIDIRTAAESEVRTVFDGSVVSIFPVPGNGSAVMLKHGNYYTVYSNLNSTNVKIGDELKNGETVGVVGKDIKSGNYILHFEVWNGKNKENPEEWIR
jgi:septal ring factor EnvC (AmiA/AmiB activator)